MAVLADDDMVMNRDTEGPRRVANIPCDCDILAAGRAVSARMVMDQYDRCRSQSQRPFDDFAGVDRCLID